MTADTDHRLAEMLLPGEEILWQGRPHYPYFRAEAWSAVPLGLWAAAMAAVLASLFGMELGNAISERRWPTPLVLLPLLVLVISVVAAHAMLFAPWTHRRKLARTVYAVTDRRVILIGSPAYTGARLPVMASETCYTFSPYRASRRKLTARKGSRVDLVLDVEPVATGGGHKSIDIGILGAEDWFAADAAILKAFGKDCPPDPPVILTWYSGFVDDK